MKTNKYFFGIIVIGLLTGLLLSGILPSCGKLADTDQFIIAKYQDEVIRRADLKEALRDMSDEDRPLIQNREDVLNALNKLINDKIKDDLAKTLRKEDKITVDRSEARIVYFKKFPEYENVYRITDPSQMDFSERHLKAMKAEVEFGIDEEVDILYRDEAHRFYTKELVSNGTITVTQEELDAEYQIYRNELKTYEIVSFDAMVFGDIEAAAAIRTRIQEGESFNQVFNEMRSKTPQLAIGRAFQNNPDQIQFRQFWHTVGGSGKGDIFGPLILPEHDVVGQTDDGRTASQKFPASFIVLEVVDRQEPREKTVDEAGIQLTAKLLLEKSMITLRDEYGVEVYEDKLYRPEGFGDQYKDSIIQTDFN
jgi:hypothetical protein